jgi:glutamate/tyrosine decarboxylase-like PLP-dependent enzyme
MNLQNPGTAEETLDPADWEAMRALAHRIVDDAIDHTRDIRDRPLWQDMPATVRAAFRGPLPQVPTALGEVYDSLALNLMPYPMGNIHPRFWCWYMGASNFTGALGDFLAAIQGSNLGIGNHAACLIDQQVVDWCKEMVGYPATASGTLVSGGSMANILGLAIARNERTGTDVRAEGIGGADLRFYGSDQIHSCHQKAIELLGLGNKALRRVPSLPDFSMDVAALAAMIAQDRAAGATPVCVIATAGTVNTGAIDDLQAIAALCQREALHFHVDGCIGALLAIAPRHKAPVQGLERADSIALDPHKWLHAPFEIGCALIRDAGAHRRGFALTPEYLEVMERGIAASHHLHDYGVQTSRGFRALKLWMAMQEHGVQKFGRLIDQNLDQAQYLTRLINDDPHLELVAPTKINIVCFRWNPGGISEAVLKLRNTEIMLRMQETGVAAVSDTTLHGHHCLRAAINNHRTVRDDLAFLAAEVVRIGTLLEAQNP